MSKLGTSVCTALVAFLPITLVQHATAQYLYAPNYQGRAVARPYAKNAMPLASQIGPNGRKRDQKLRNEAS